MELFHTIMPLQLYKSILLWFACFSARESCKKLHTHDSSRYPNERRVIV